MSTTREMAVKVSRCPHCYEFLPGSASICTTCGKSLPAYSEADATASTLVRPRPHSLKMPRFYPVESGEETLSPREMFTAETVKIGPRSSSSDAKSTLSSQLESIDDSRRGTNWHKVVDSRPSRPPTISRPPAPRPLVLPQIPRSSVPPGKQPGKARRPSPYLFFYVSIILIALLVMGGLLGIVVSLSRGILQPPPPHHNELSLKVTPASVNLGRMITLRGTSFSPNGRIGLTRDTNIPIFDTGGESIILANSQGTFTDTVIVDPDWQDGSHVIRAEDATLHKTAGFTITVTGHSSSLRPAHLLLSTNTVDLGTGDQATNSTQKISLTNAGGGQITWYTTTTQPWLLLTPKSGTFASGQKVHVRIAAERANLKPGAYAAEVIFSSNAGQATLPVKMKTTLLQPGHEAVLQLTPPVLAFTGTDGGVSPQAQVVTISNPGVRPLQWSASINDGRDWLAVSSLAGSVPKGGSEPVAIAINTSALLPGTYEGSVTFTGQGEGIVKDSPQTVYISLTVVTQCVLQVSPGGLAFTSVYQQPGPTAKIISLNVSQGCATHLQWSASVSTNNGGQWLNMGAPRGVTPSYPSISVNVAGLQPGVYNGAVIFTSTAGTQTLPVNFTMAQSAAPSMTTTAPAMAFSGIVGQSDPQEQTITITNAGGGTLRWHAFAATNVGGSWLGIAPAHGVLYSHQSVTVNVTTSLLSGLPPDTYNGTVTITGVDDAGNSVAGSPQTIPVSLTVQPPCTLALASPALTFTGVSGQSNPAGQSATLSANGTCMHMLNWTASSAEGWLTASPAAGRVGLGVAATTQVGVVLAGLGAKTYTGEVTIRAFDSATHQQIGTPQSITVTLIVQPPCTLLAPSVPGETFNTEVGLNPPTQSFTIGLIGACTGNVTITPTVTGGSWLTVTPPSATINGGSATFTVTVTSASLPPGPYKNSISLAAVDGGMAILGSPQVVNVSLQVMATPSLTINPNPGPLAFNVTTGTTTQPITIGNGGQEPLNWTAALVAGAPAFVTLSAGSGTGLAGGTNTSVNVIVDATKLPGGSAFTTSVTITAVDPITGNTVAGSPATIGIVINVAQPSMQVSTNGLTFTTTVGNNPPPQSLVLTNTGGDGLTWTAGAPSVAWLTLSVTGCSDSSGGTSTITFTVNATGLVAGTYPATVVITPSVGNAITETVVLTVNKPS